MAVKVEVGADRTPVTLIIDTGSPDLVFTAKSRVQPPEITPKSTNVSVGIIVDQEAVTFAPALSTSYNVSIPLDSSQTLALTATAAYYAWGTAWTGRHTRPRQVWSDVEGVLGVSRPIAWLRQTAFRDILASVHRSGTRSVLALDFASANASALYIDEPLPTWARNALPTTLPASRQYYAFSVFSLSVCGAQVTQPHSVVVPAIVDTGAACLALPGEVFDNVMTWARAECRTDNPTATGGTWRRRCFAPRDTDAESLPALSFATTMSGQSVHLPLAALLLPPTAGGDRELCVERLQTGQLDLGARSSGTPSIVFGTVPLRALRAVMDVASGTVAFAPAPVAPATSRACAAPVTCAGLQIPMPPSNSCLDPPCGRFPLMRVTSDGLECEYAPALAYCVAIPLAVGLLLDIFIRRSTHGLLVGLARRLRGQDPAVQWPPRRRTAPGAPCPHPADAHGAGAEHYVDMPEDAEDAAGESVRRAAVVPARAGEDPGGDFESSAEEDEAEEGAGPAGADHNTPYGVFVQVRELSRRLV